MEINEDYRRVTDRQLKLILVGFGFWMLVLVLLIVLANYFNL